MSYPKETTACCGPDFNFRREIAEEITGEVFLPLDQSRHSRNPASPNTGRTR